MGGPVQGAKLLGPESRQGLHLVATGKKGEFVGVGGADVLQSLSEHVQSFFPRDLDELSGPALSAGFTHKRILQAGGGALLHDARRPFSAEDAFIDRVVAVALNKPYLVVFYGDFYSTAAGAHIAGGVFDLLLAVVLGFWDCGHKDFLARQDTD
jgi:hypothetical protein